MAGEIRRGLSPQRPRPSGGVRSAISLANSEKNETPNSLTNPQTSMTWQLAEGKGEDQRRGGVEGALTSSTLTLLSLLSLSVR